MTDRTFTDGSGVRERLAEIRKDEYAEYAVIGEQFGPGFGLSFSTDNELSVAGRTNVMRIESTGPFDASQWTNVLVGSGTVGHTAGEMVVATGTTANSSAKATSTLKGRQMSGTTQRYITVVRLSDLGTVNNIRRWGYYDDLNGFFYQVNGTAFSVGYRNAGVDTLIPFASCNGPGATTFDPAVDLVFGTQYDLYFGGLRARWIVGGKVLHAAGGKPLTTPLTEVLSLPFRQESINSGGLTTNCQIMSRGHSFHRLSAFDVTPRYKNITTATTTVVRTGAGTFRSIVVNNPTTAGTITIYDNTAGSGPKIATINIPGSTNSPFELKYGTEVTDGLTVVTSVANDITILFD